MKFKIGDRVRFKRNVDRRHYGFFKVGMTGTVVEIDDSKEWGRFSVRLDQHVPELDDWNNCIHWYADLYDGDDLIAVVLEDITRTKSAIDLFLEED